MPYRMLEEIQSRKKEKVALFLTFENIVGLILFGFPTLIASAPLPLLLRAPLVLGAALLGVFVTLEAQGLPIYERVLWRARGFIRIRSSGGIIRPEDLSGASAPPARERPLDIDGPVQSVDRATIRRRPLPAIATRESQNGAARGRLRAE